MERIDADVVVVGGGLAGLWAVLHLPGEWQVVVVDKGTGGAGSSPLAQGGMAVAAGPDDSPERHAADTVRAGAGACDHAAVRILTEEAPSALSQLVQLGCVFDRRPDGSFDLHREGGQSVARSVHSADATGREIMRVVAGLARGRATRIVGTVVRLLVDDDGCHGAVVLGGSGPVAVTGRAVLLATGGCGALYEATTNTPGSTGDAVALAWEAGAGVEDLELVQFHPTALGAGGLQRVLLTEALRGAGATVVDEAGTRFLLGEHPDGELGPRDVVARAIARRGGAFLDARSIGEDALRRRFPNVYAAVLEAGFDQAREPVPVAPAAHYLLGGVATDYSGRTSVRGLYAAGECAATGVHGANRMAGNSLAEAVVFGLRAAVALADEPGPRPRVPATLAQPARYIDEEDDWRALRAAMSKGAGLFRDAASLASARETAEKLAASAHGDELRLAAVAASLVARSGAERDESRGVHYRSDAPERRPDLDGRHVRLLRS